MVEVRAFNAVSGDWETAKLPPRQPPKPEQIGVGVATEQTEETLAAWLLDTPMDKLADVTKTLLTPESLLPKFLGAVTAGVAVRAGIPHFLAQLAGDAVEQATGPLFEPEGLPAGEGLEVLTVTHDLAGGLITSAVLNAALDRLADQLKKQLDENGGEPAQG